jgi:hypothetical protein
MDGETTQDAAVVEDCKCGCKDGVCMCADCTNAACDCADCKVKNETAA